jgi:glycosyltransferase involved in cell wall biosynthesis
MSERSHRGAVGLVLDQIVVDDGRALTTDEVFVRFVEALARSRFERAELCCRLVRDTTSLPYTLDRGTFEIVPLPAYRDVPDLCRRALTLLPAAARTFDARMPGWALAVGLGVHPLTPLAIRKARRRGIPAVLWVRGDLEADIRHRHRGLRRLAGLAAARAVIAAIPKGTPVVSVGRDDYPFLRSLGPCHLVYSSKFEDADFVTKPHERPGSDRAARLLYVGRIAPEKGVEVLLDAFRRVRAALPGRPPVLTIAGYDYRGSDYGREFRRRVEGSDLAGSVSFAGHVPYGPALFALYDAHDVLVLPSFTEGFPQVLLEAMARGVPVAATAVGGVPRVVRDRVNGRIVAPGDAAAFAGAVAELLSDPAESTRLAAAGLATARGYTRTAQIESLNRFLDTCFPGMLPQR